MVSGLVLESSAMESRRSFAPTRGTYRLHSHARMSRTPNFWGSKYRSDLRALDFNVSTNLEPQGIENDTNKQVSPRRHHAKKNKKAGGFAQETHQKPIGSTNYWLGWGP